MAARPPALLLDTNTAVSALLWSGLPSQLIISGDRHLLSMGIYTSHAAGVD
jgi:predicted nucleic acid-binding protein